jgi:hypothetical protein
MAATLNSRPNAIVLRLEQDQCHDRWIPLEDDDAIPHKQTYDFLVFMGKDPSSENFFLTSQELSDILETRFTIELNNAKGMLLENNIKAQFDTIRWKDHARNRFAGISRNEKGRYGDPMFGRSMHHVWEKLFGLIEDRGPRNINR